MSVKLPRNENPEIGRRSWGSMFVLGNALVGNQDISIVFYLKWHERHFAHVT